MNQKTVMYDIFDNKLLNEYEQQKAEKSSDHKMFLNGIASAQLKVKSWFIELVNQYHVEIKKHTLELKKLKKARFIDIVGSSEYESYKLIKQMIYDKELIINFLMSNIPIYKNEVRL